MSNIDHKVTGIPVIDKIYDEDFMKKISFLIPHPQSRKYASFPGKFLKAGAYAARWRKAYEENCK